MMTRGEIHVGILYIFMLAHRQRRTIRVTEILILKVRARAVRLNSLDAQQQEHPDPVTPDQFSGRHLLQPNSNSRSTQNGGVVSQNDHVHQNIQSSR